ncbi:high mobility group nucleosome-binding domain-containing protein 5-like [Macrobrachium nipponense]|uniref:high mobility group nucleosome-binding domain-containing protein 5-like n=1 Tax=Macrobrachium nipponense TaxID=159736 RepID=UPI0030C88B24
MEGLKEMEWLKEELWLGGKAKERLEVENERLRVECEELKSELEEMRGMLRSAKVEMKEEVKRAEERMVEKMDKKFGDKDKPEDKNKKGAEEKKKTKGKKVSKGNGWDETRTEYIEERAESNLDSGEWKQVGRKKKGKKGVVKFMDVSMEVDLLDSEEGKKGQNGNSESGSRDIGDFLKEYEKCCEAKLETLARKKFGDEGINECKELVRKLLATVPVHKSET